MQNLDNEFAELWANCISRQRKLTHTKAIQEKLECTARKGLLEPFAKSGGGIYLRRDRRGKLRAAVLISCSPKYHFAIVSAPRDRAAHNWAKTILNDHLPKGGRPCEGRIEPGQMDLLPWLCSQGFGIRSVRLEGGVESSLRRLRRHYGKKLRTPFEQAGLTIAAARSSAEITPYLRILRTEYRRNPQFGTHVTDPRFQRAIRRDLARTMKHGEKSLWLIRRNGKLVGGVDVFESSSHIDGKRRAWFGVNLTRELQGKNCARAIYEAILMELQKRGVERYLGSTAQPGVMRLGKIMGRRLWGVEVDRGVTKEFSRAHFKGWVR